MSFNVGDIVTGTVTGIEDYGIFISFPDKSSGLVHISEISDDFVKNVWDYAEIDSQITTLVIGIESESHYRLSIKALNVDSNKNSRKIKETSLGFSTLSNVLDNWVEDSYLEISKKS